MSSSKALPLVASTKGDFTEAIQNNAVYKERSHTTHWQTHVPEIEARLKTIKESPQSDASALKVALLGSSSLERFKSTGKTLAHVALLGDSMLERFKTKVPSSSIATRADTINLGVGGDKIQHVIYRVSLGLPDLLQAFSVKLWVIHVGSNNLNSGKGPLKPQEINKLHLLLRAIFSKSSDETKILVCGIFERRDMQPGQVANSNTLLIDMIRKLKEKEGIERVLWEPMPADIDLKMHLADDAHLNRTGYAIWDRVLSARIDALLK